MNHITISNHSLRLPALMVLITILVAGCGVLPVQTGANLVTKPDQIVEQAQPATTVGDTATTDEPLLALEGTFERIYQQVSPSVVNIRVVTKVDATTLDNSQFPSFPFFNLPDDQQSPEQYQSGLGSGFVWDKAGHIVTNNHVVDGADKIEVTFSDGTIVPAESVGTDPDSDLAVIKVDYPEANLIPVRLADSTTLKVGQLAIAIGNPFGLEGTMTVGIISALGRSLPTGDGLSPSYTIPDIIQTDAPINPGNSGGVLVDNQGQVVGVTAAIESPVRANAGIGFAIPSAIVNQVVPALITTGHYDHTWLGISGSSLVPELATAMDLDASQRGVLVGDVIPDSPADKAGLMGSTRQVEIEGQQVRVGGDIITAIDGQTLRQMDDLIAYLASYTQVGQKVTLNILRDGKAETLNATLAARPVPEETAATNNTESPAQGAHLGIIGLNLDPAIAAAMDLPENTQGVLVEQVERGSAADEAGIRGSYKPQTIEGQQILIGGDIITAIDKQTVTGMADLKAALAKMEPGQKTTLTILRDGKQQQVAVTLGK